MAVSSPRQRVPGGMVGTVDGGVTLDAGAANHEFIRRQAGFRGMSRGHVTLLAEPRQRKLQHLLANSPVRLVAIHAVFGDRGMLPEKRSALLGVTAVTKVVRRVGREKRFGDRAVRVVARRASHLSFPQRHVGIAEHLRATSQVALGADFGLGRFGQLSPVRQFMHQPMAGRAADVSTFVSAPLPIKTPPVLVTRETDRVFLANRVGRLPAEGDEASYALPASGFCVSFAGPVAGFAAAQHERRTRVFLGENLRVHRLCEVVLVVLMTGEAHLGARVPVGRCRSRLGRRSTVNDADDEQEREQQSSADDWPQLGD